MQIEQIRPPLSTQLAVHQPVDGAPRPGSGGGPVPALPGVGVVGEPGQGEQFDLLLLGALRQCLQLAQPLLLRGGHAPGDLLAVSGAPVSGEGSAQQQHRAHPARMRQAETAGQIRAVGVPDQHGLRRVPRVEQLGEIVDVPGESVSALPSGRAGTALVVAVDPGEVGDRRGELAQIVRQPRAAVQHDHRSGRRLLPPRPPADPRPVGHCRKALSSRHRPRLRAFHLAFPIPIYQSDNNGTTWEYRALREYVARKPRLFH